MGFKYRETVLAELSRHGVMPDDKTPPEIAHDLITALYLYEIRALRDRMRDGLIAKEDYSNHVTELRKRYPILSLPVRHWTEPE